MERYQGACHCGRVRFALEGPPMMAACCHCSICRRWSGAAYSMMGFWKPELCQVTSELPLFERATSAWLTRFRCADCGTPVYNAVRSYADRIVDVEDGLPRHDRFKWSPREAPVRG